MDTIVRKEEGAQALGSVSSGLCGSTNVMFDAYCGPDSNLELVRNPTLLQEMIRGKIARSGMTWRTGMLDVWHGEEHPPGSSFDSLEESHVRSETWPQVSHVQGEGQLCNYTRDNSTPTIDLVKDFILELKPEYACIQIIYRGPNKSRSILIGDQYGYTPERGFYLIRKGAPAPAPEQTVPFDERHPLFGCPVGTG